MTPQFIYRLALPVLCLLASCTAWHSKKSPAVLFPLEVGRYWQYQVSSGDPPTTVENEIASSQTVGNIIWFESVEYGERFWIRNGQQGQVEAVNLYTEKKKAAVFERLDPKALDEQLMFKYPAKPGDSWITLENILHVDSEQSMDVPAGHFTCLMYSITRYNQAYTHSCIAPGVGIIYSDILLPNGKLEISRLVKWGKK